MGKKQAQQQKKEAQGLHVNHKQEVDLATKFQTPALQTALSK